MQEQTKSDAMTKMFLLNNKVKFKPNFKKGSIQYYLTFTCSDKKL